MRKDVPDIEPLLRGAVERLSKEFTGTYSRESVELMVRDSFDRVRGLRPSPHLADFAYRFARERLGALAGTEGRMLPKAPRILFVCVRNASRSQMAAAFARHLSNGQLETHSAGSAPANRVNPTVLAVMAELGIDLSDEFPKPLTDEVVRAAGVVITMGCGDACPIYPFKKYEDWSIESPEGQPLQRVREIRDGLRDHVERLISQLAVLNTW